MRGLSRIQRIILFSIAVCHCIKSGKTDVAQKIEHTKQKEALYFQLSEDAEVFEIRNMDIYEDSYIGHKISLARIMKDSWVRTTVESPLPVRDFIFIEHTSGLVGYVEKRRLVPKATQDQFFNIHEKKFLYVEETQSEKIAYEFDERKISASAFYDAQKWNPKSIYFLPRLDASIFCGAIGVRDCTDEKPFEATYRAYLRLSVKRMQNRINLIKNNYAPSSLEKSRTLAVQVLESKVKLNEFLIDYLLTANVDPYFEFFPRIDRANFTKKLQRIYQENPLPEGLPRWRAVKRLFEEYSMSQAYPQISAAYQKNWMEFMREFDVKSTVNCIANCNE